MLYELFQKGSNIYEKLKQSNQKMSSLHLCCIMHLILHSCLTMDSKLNKGKRKKRKLVYFKKEINKKINKKTPTIYTPSIQLEYVVRYFHILMRVKWTCNPHGVMFFMLLYKALDILLLLGHLPVFCHQTVTEVMDAH